MKRFQKLAGIVLATVMIAQAFALSVSADVYDAGERRGKNGGDLRVEGDWTASFSAKEDAPFSIYTLTPEYENRVFLENASIDLADRDFVNFLALEPGADVRLYLSGVNTITAGTGRAGITVPEGAKLTILGSGSLTVTGGTGGAGIGGDSGRTGGEIVIGEQIEFIYSSIRVYANGGADAAGIGGGSGGDGSGVTIWGGLTAATGGGTAQDIGAGAGGTPGNTWLYGGRLVNYDNIGWAPNDSAARQQVRVDVDSLGDVMQVSIDAYTAAGTTGSVATTYVPTGTGGWEQDVAYLYIPASFKEVRLNLVPTKVTNAQKFRRMTVSQVIPEDGSIRVNFADQ